MISSVPLSVVLNGTRDYVQGSQLVFQAIEKVLEHGATDLLSVSFHAITDRLVRLTDEADEIEENNLGDLTVRTQDGRKAIMYFVAQPQMAPRKTRPARVRYKKLAQSGPLDAIFAVENVESLEDFFDALVQSVKSLHEDLADDVEDVWFTGVRGKTFPLQPDIRPSSGKLTVDYKRILRGNCRWQTLMGFAFVDQVGQIALAGGLTFAFKSGTKPDVD